MPIMFNYETNRIDKALTVDDCLKFIADLHSELADSGAWEHLSDETNLNLNVIANEADKRNLK